MLDILNELRTITSGTPGCTRLAYTEEEDQAHDYIWGVMQSLPGLVRIGDAAGNMFIVPEHATEPGAQPIALVGSHLDTVIEAGWLDGTLGVVAGVHAMMALTKNGRANPQLGLIVFRDEEGVRFEAGLFGSKAFAGLCSPEDLDRCDSDGVSMRDVAPDPDGCLSYTPPVTPAAFFETHIEQGLRLEDANERIGAVTSLVGIRRFQLRGVGAANHAGTTEMSRRRDALIPVASLVSRLPDLVEDMPDAVITCGRLSVEPGAANTVPGTATGTVEIRAGNVGDLDMVEQRFRDAVAGCAAETLQRSEVKVEVKSIVNVTPTPTDPGLTGALCDVLTEMNVPHRTLSSMAGHDTQHAALVCPSSMFFIPSLKGISHNPAEDSRPEDINLAGDVMARWIERSLPTLVPAG